MQCTWNQTVLPNNRQHRSCIFIQCCAYSDVHGSSVSKRQFYHTQNSWMRSIIYKSKHDKIAHIRNNYLWHQTKELLPVTHIIDRQMQYFHQTKYKLPLTNTTRQWCKICKKKSVPENWIVSNCCVAKRYANKCRVEFLIRYTTFSHVHNSHSKAERHRDRREN